MCQRFVNDFVEKVIEKSEPSTFYLLLGWDGTFDYGLDRICKLSCYRSELNQKFVDSLIYDDADDDDSASGRSVMIYHLCKHFKIIDYCDCSLKNCDVCEEKMSRILIDYRQEVKEQLSPILLKLDLMEFFNHRELDYGYWYLVEDRTGLLEKIAQYNSVYNFLKI